MKYRNLVIPVILQTGEGRRPEERPPLPTAPTRGGDQSANPAQAKGFPTHCPKKGFPTHCPKKGFPTHCPKKRISHTLSQKKDLLHTVPKNVSRKLSQKHGENFITFPWYYRCIQLWGVTEFWGLNFFLVLENEEEVINPQALLMLKDLQHTVPK